MRTVNQGRLCLVIVTVLLLAVPFPVPGQDQEEDLTICIDIDTIKNPNGVDFYVSWSPCRDGQRLPDNTLQRYRVECYPVDDPNQKDIETIIPADDRIGNLGHKFTNLEYDKAYAFHVIGVGDSSFPESEIKELLVEREESGGPGFFAQMWIAFKEATIPGQVAFIVIFLFLLSGIFVLWFMKAWSAFRAENVFLKHRKEYMDPAKYRRQQEEEVSQIRAKLEAVKESRSGGPISREQRVLEARLRKEEEDVEAFEIFKRIDELGNSIVEDVDLFRNRFFSMSSKLADNMLWIFSCRWLIKLSGKKPTLNIRDVPTLKILWSGIEASDEGSDIHNALDVRVASEISKLRERSFIDAIWGIGVTAPLIGLFGTITGLTAAFNKVSQIESGSASRILKDLGGGIHEALFTTFFGLLAGIILMLVYYYYNYKLERITALWEEAAANLLDMIKRKKREDNASKGGKSGPLNG